MPEHVMNNSSMFTADRLTHLKIVVVALVCATILAGMGIAARVSYGANAASHQMEATVIKVGKPITAQSQTSVTIR
jgi:hypothetical protein